MTLVIPLVAKPAQTLTVTLGAQPCQLTVRQRATGLYVDLSVADVPIVRGVLAHNRVPLVRSAYLGFTGDLQFYDTQGLSDPDYTGLGGRFVLLWA